MTRRITAFVVTVVSVLGLSASKTHAATITDPGFESGLAVASGIGGWGVFQGADFSVDQALTGTWSMFAAAGFGFVPGSVQFLPAAPGSEWELTGYGLHTGLPTGASGNPVFGVIQLTFFSGLNGAGSDLGTVETSPGNARTSAPITAASATNSWLFLDVSATAPVGTQSIGVYTIFVNFNSARSTSPVGVYFDDLTLTEATAVPEPATIVLVGIGLLGVACRRR